MNAGNRAAKSSFHFEVNHFDEVAGWVHEYERFWNERLDQFEQYFKDKKEEGEEVMKKSTKTIEIKVERTIPAPLDEVFDGWLNPKIPGNPWNAAEKFILDPKVDGLFYWLLKGTSHYGRFTESRATGSNSAYLGVTEYLGTRIDGHCDLQETGRRHPHDPRAFRPSGH